MQRVQNLKGIITQIVIAHRLSTIEEADMIIVLHEGKKIGQGTFQELLITCQEFATMYRFSSLKKHSDIKNP